MNKLDVRLTLVGGPTVVIDIAGFRILTDPTFDPPQRYELGAVALAKTIGPAVRAEDLGRIDAVLLSHDQHADNLDVAGRALLPLAEKTFTTRIGAQRLRALGDRVMGMAPWETRALENAAGRRLWVTATPARHGPPGVEPITGDVVGFLLGLDQEGDAIYFSGDTVWYEGVAEIARRFRPRLAILNVGSAQPRGAFHVTMDANDAIETACAFADAQIVAIHNEGWAHFKESPEDLAKAFFALGLGARLHKLTPGAPYDFAL